MDFLDHIDEKGLEQTFLQILIHKSPFKIGDEVRIVAHENDKKWVISDISLGFGKLIFLLQHNAFSTWGSEDEIKFYYS